MSGPKSRAAALASGSVSPALDRLTASRISSLEARYSYWQHDESFSSGQDSKLYSSSAGATCSSRSRRGMSSLEQLWQRVGGFQEAFGADVRVKRGDCLPIVSDECLSDRCKNSGFVQETGGGVSQGVKRQSSACAAARATVLLFVMRFSLAQPCLGQQVAELVG